MKRSFTISLSILLLLIVNSVAAQTVTCDYLDPVSTTIKENDSTNIFGRIFITGITSQPGNSSLINATLLLSNADLPGFQGDPRFGQYNVATFPSIFNTQVNDIYEYKTKVNNLPIGNYNFCYKYVYNSTTYLGGAVGDPGWFHVGTLKVVSSSTSVENMEIIPISFSLSQIYPNPFNPTTTIYYSIPKTSFVSIKVFDVLGNEIKTLVKEEKIAGNHSIEFNANKLTSGIYLYRMQADNFSETKKLILLK